MTLRFSLFCLLTVFFVAQVSADTGKEEIGKVKTALFLGCNDADVDAGERAKKVSDKAVKSLVANSNFKFAHYFLLGEDTSAVLRSYENWSTPLKPSEAIMLSFEPVGKASGKKIMLDMDLWQSKKKIMKKAHTLELGKPLLIRGPQWRGGYLIISVELTELK